MKSTIKRWGNSLALRLPKELAQTLELDEGSSITLEIVEGGLMLKAETKRPKRDLDTLLRGVTRNRIHAQVDWGAPVGKEVW